MKRRLPSGDALTPRQRVTVFESAWAEVDRLLPDRSDPRRPLLLGRLLAEHGTDAVECIRARRELRRGR